MKYQKQPNIFSFIGYTKKEFMDKLNKEYPINLIYNEELISRIHAKYPYITKSEVALIIKATFISFRDFLILGKVLNLNKLFFDTKLFFYTRHRIEKILNLKIKASTPPIMKIP